jgi:CRP/FNR family transcriptional regulator, anaerobic regulatory protein
MQTFIEQYGTLAKGEYEQFQNQTTVHLLVRDEYLLRPGQICDQVFFVKKGCLQLNSIGYDGKEVGIKIAVENKFITDCESFFTGTPSRCSIRALEDSVVRALPPHIVETCTSPPTICRAIRRLLDFLVVDYQLRITSIMSRDAQGRFQFLLANEPELLLRLQWNLLAKYLGIPWATFLHLEKTLNHE